MHRHLTEKGKTFRFKENKNARAEKLEGTYSIEFTFESGKKERSVAVFKQNGNQLTGTFLKESGDSRYLQGIAEGNKFYLSSFIGSTPGYYTGEVHTDGTIEGEQIGSRVHHQFRGKRDSYAALPNPYEKLNVGERKKLAPFSFPDIAGNMVSLSDEKGANKWDSTKEGHFHLVVEAPPAEVQELINKLIMHQPVNKN